MGFAQSLPSLRPIPVCEIEAGLSIGIVEGFIHGNRAGLGIKFQQVKALLATTTGDHNALGFRVPTRPVRKKVIVEFKSRNLDRLRSIRNIQHNQIVSISIRFAADSGQQWWGRRKTKRETSRQTAI